MRHEEGMRNIKESRTSKKDRHLYFTMQLWQENVLRNSFFLPSLYEKTFNIFVKIIIISALLFAKENFPAYDRKSKRKRRLGMKEAPIAFRPAAPRECPVTSGLFVSPFSVRRTFRTEFRGNKKTNKE